MGAAKASPKAAGKRKGPARKARRRTKLAANAGKLIGRGGQATYRTGRRVGTARGAVRGARIHRRIERGTGRVAAAAVAIGTVIGFLAGRALGRRGASPESGEPGSESDDQDVAEKVRSEILRSSDGAKGDVTVSVEDGSIYLRGEVPDPAVAEDLVARARRVHGVGRVVNLLHAPGQPSPSKGTRKTS